MRYIMFVCADPAAEKYVPEEDNIDEWVGAMDRRKVRILGNRLKGVEDAATVRRRNGKVLVTDGPFAETKEWIAGFDILECANLDEGRRNSHATSDGPLWQARNPAFLAGGMNERGHLYG